MDYTGLYNRSQNLKYKQTPFNGGDRIGGGNTFGLCACTGDLQNMDVGVYASSTNQLERRCRRRGNQLNQELGTTGSCGAPYLEAGGGNRQIAGNTIVDFNLPIYTQR
jgi:hypothetical protein